MNPFQLQLKDLNLEILNCDNRTNQCQLQQFGPPHNRFTTYPEIIWAGNKYGEPNNPRILFIGISPRQADDTHQMHHLDAGSRLSFTLHLHQQNPIMCPNPFDLNFDIPLLSNQEYNRLIQQFFQRQSFTYQYNRIQYTVDTAASFQHFQRHWPSYSYEAILHLFFNFIPSPPDQIYDYLAVTNACICGGQRVQALNRVATNMFTLCWNKEYLKRAIIKLKPHAIFCYGKEAWQFIEYLTHSELPGVMATVNIEDQVILCQRTFHLSGRGYNDAVFQAFNIHGPGMRMRIVNQMAENFRPVFQGLFPNVHF